MLLVSEANKKLQDTNDHIQGMVDMPSLGGNSPMPSRRSLQVGIITFGVQYWPMLMLVARWPAGPRWRLGTVTGWAGSCRSWRGCSGSSRVAAPDLPRSSRAAPRTQTLSGEGLASDGVIGFISPQYLHPDQSITSSIWSQKYVVDFYYPIRTVEPRHCWTAPGMVSPWQ